MEKSSRQSEIYVISVQIFSCILLVFSIKKRGRKLQLAFMCRLLYKNGLF